MSTIFGDSKSPPKGWTTFNGVLTPDTTLAGYWARGREVRGICQTRDCRRSCHVDLERYVEKGLGRLALKDLLPYLLKAFIAIEDRRFYSHFGVDPTGILRALVTNVLHRGVA